MAQKTVYVELIAETKKLNAGMKKADKKVGMLTKAFKRLGGAIVAAFGARAVFRGFTQTIKSTEDLIKTAKGVGFTAKQYERLTFALSEVGVGAESARIALGDFQKRLARPSFQKFFREAGFKPKELLKLPAEEQLFTVMEELAKLRDDPRLASAAGLIFEEQSGKDIRKVLIQWERFVQARKDYDRIVKRGLTKEDANNLEEVGRQVRLLGLRWTVLKRNIVLDVVPDILTALESLEEVATSTAVADGYEELGKVLNTVRGDVEFLADGFVRLGNAIPDLPDWAKKLFTRLASPALGLGVALPHEFIKGIEALEGYTARGGLGNVVAGEQPGALAPVLAPPSVSTPSPVSNYYEIKVDATGDSVISRKNADKVGASVAREVESRQ